MCLEEGGTAHHRGCEGELNPFAQDLTCMGSGYGSVEDGGQALLIPVPTALSPFFASSGPAPSCAPRAPATTPPGSLPFPLVLEARGLASGPAALLPAPAWPLTAEWPLLLSPAFLRRDVLSACPRGLSSDSEEATPAGLSWAWCPWSLQNARHVHKCGGLHFASCLHSASTAPGFCVWPY